VISSEGNCPPTWRGEMDSIQSAIWRDMAKEAMVVADQMKNNPPLQREMRLMAARYMAMADMVEGWSPADQYEPE
jgi:hypothetical protein